MKRFRNSLSNLSIERWVSYFLMIVVFITIIFFLWEELTNLHTSEKINHDKFSSFFTSIGALLTAYSLVLIYLQLKESKKQNDFATQPALFIERKSYTLKEEPDNAIVNGFVNVVPPDNTIKDNWGIKIINIGKGTALKIAAEWIYDINKINKLTETHYRQVGIMKKNFYKDYLRPDEELFIGLPYDYINLFGKKLHPTHNNSEMLDFSEKPDLSVKIKYIDIEHKPYSKQFVSRTDSDTIFLHFDFEEIHINKA